MRKRLVGKGRVAPPSREASSGNSSTVVPSPRRTWTGARVTRSLPNRLSASREGAPLAAELARGDGPPRVYRVEPVGTIEDDPNLIQILKN